MSWSTKSPATVKLPKLIARGDSGCLAVVKHALTPLLPPDQLIKVEVKRSSRSKLSADGRGVKRKWWFTILAPEVTLSIIDTNWHLLSARSSWSLQHSLQSSGHPPAFKSPVQKHVNNGSGPVVSSGDLQGSVQVDKDRVSNVSAVRHQGSVQGNLAPVFSLRVNRILTTYPFLWMWYYPSHLDFLRLVLAHSLTFIYRPVLTLPMEPPLIRCSSRLLLVLLLTSSWPLPLALLF